MTAEPQDLHEGSASLTRAGAQARVYAVDSRPEPVLAGVPSLPSPATTPREAEPGWRAKISAATSRPGTLPDAQPMTFRQAHARHRECAHHTGGIFREGYGWLHMTLVKAPLNYFEWGTQTPLGLLIHILLGLAVWLGLLAGGYL
jgi:hypothetical protein